MKKLNTKNLNTVSGGLNPEYSTYTGEGDCYKAKYTLKCLGCGCKWNEEIINSQISPHVLCPKCGSDLIQAISEHFQYWWE